MFRKESSNVLRTRVAYVIIERLYILHICNLVFDRKRTFAIKKREGSIAGSFQLLMISFINGKKMNFLSRIISIYLNVLQAMGDCFSFISEYSNSSIRRCTQLALDYIYHILETGHSLQKKKMAVLGKRHGPTN